MTPAARVAAAIEILDAVIAGASAERTLTNWARRSRFAGSGDRAAVRDLVFDALRCRRSYGWLGGGDTGRSLLIGALRAQGVDPESVFTGEGHGPDALSDIEAATRVGDMPPAVALDIPDWLLAPLQDSLGDEATDILKMMQSRAPVFLRVNSRVTTRQEACERLLQDGVEAEPFALSATALVVLRNPRKVQTSSAFREGLVEIQDAASQAVVDALDLSESASVLDYCAGGGGKALGLAARTGGTVFAHDADPARMSDMPGRAARAGADIVVLDRAGLAACGPFDLVLCDAPCSGSGAWRRSPEAKWRLTPERLDELCALQGDILRHAAGLVKKGGMLAYATCSMLEAENERQVERFLQENQQFEQLGARRFTPLDGGDGFYVAQMRRLTDRL